ncbi:MAG: nucleotide-binding protein [Myxococcota bacterium]
MVAILASTVVGLAGGGCGGSSEPTLSCDVPTLLTEKCGGGQCHGGPQASQPLDLVSPGVAARVANVTAPLCGGNLANPADPEGSLMFQKVAGTQSCGGPMPQNSGALSADEILCMRDWISGLLPPQQPEGDAGPDCPQCECRPGDMEVCYSGPDGTADSGVCQAGLRQCVAAGSVWVWGVCEDEVIPRGEDCTTAADENCDGVTPPCSEWWSQGFGSYQEDQASSLRSVAVDANGDIYALGDFVGTASFGGAPLTASGEKADIVLAKFDHFGNHLWSKRFGDSSNQYASQVVVDDAGEVIIAVRVYGTINFGGIVRDAVGEYDIAIAKFDRDGNWLWDRIFGGRSGDRTERVAVDSRGDVVITGQFRDTVDFGSGGFVATGITDPFVLKLDGDTGAHLWSHQLVGTGDNDYGWGVATDADDHIYLTGRFTETIDILGTELTSLGSTDVYVAKLDSDGALMFAQRHGGSGEDGPFDLALDPASGRFAITGYMSLAASFGGGLLTSAGSRDLFLAVYDRDGDHVMSRNYGDDEDQFESSIDATTVWNSLDVDAAGNFYIGGYLSHTVDFGGPTLASAGRTDAFLVKLSPDGQHLFGNRYGRTGTEVALDIAVADTGHVVLVGRYFGTSMDFGASGVITRTGPDSSDGFLVRFEP